MVVVVSPTTLPEPPALEAATMAGEITDVHAAVKHAGGDGAADQRGGDVVEERRQHEYHHQQQKAAFPIVRQPARQNLRYVAFLEVARQQGESEQQSEQVSQHHPFVMQVAEQSGNAAAGMEAGDQQFVEGDRGQAGERDRQRVVVEQRHAQQGQLRTE